MSDPYKFPQLRWPLDLNIQQLDGRDILVIRDPQGISPAPLALVAEVSPLVASLEGRASIEEIAQKFSPIGCTQQLIEELVKLLDNSLYLRTPKFYAAERDLRDNYAALEVRAAALAGGAYAADSGGLRKELDGFLANGNGVNLGQAGRLLGVVSPHIDYRRGGVCYGITYSQLDAHSPDLYLVIGTSHQYGKGLFHLSRKHFASPLGQANCDREFVDNIAKKYGAERALGEELLHRTEHSLELQIPFLRRIEDRKAIPSGRPSQIVPILVGSFHHMLEGSKNPNEFDEYESFVGALSDEVRRVENQGRRVCVVAGVDMAHVGRNFGDSGSLTPEFMEQIRARDQIYLDAIRAQDKTKLFQHIAEDRDARRICGFPTMYTVIDLFDRLGVKYRAELFDYRQAVDYKSDCAVTFAGIGIYGPAL